MQIFHDTAYTSDNLSAVSALWEKLSGDPGVVALSTDYVSEKRLPHAYRFPWDEDKGVYLLQGFHNLHCLVCTCSILRKLYVHLETHRVVLD